MPLPGQGDTSSGAVIRRLDMYIMLTILGDRNGLGPEKFVCMDAPAMKIPECMHGMLDCDC